MAGKIRLGSKDVAGGAVSGGGRGVNGAFAAYDTCMTAGTLMTADELLRMPHDDSRYELVRGELRKMSPSGEDHGYVSIVISSSLWHFVSQRNLGRVYPADAG